MEQLVFATNNRHKLEEVKKILGNQFKIIGLEDAGITEDIPENADSLEGNAAEKARFMYHQLKINVFADDTGLEVDALNGAPGVYSARYAGEKKDPVDNMNLVLKKLDGETNRKAQFRTVICLIYNHKEYYFEGIVKGSILTKPHGSAGFGYDPVFLPEGFNQSFAEMPMELKNTISHRGKAIEKLSQFLNEQRKMR